MLPKQYDIAIGYMIRRKSKNKYQNVQTGNNKARYKDY